MIRSFGCLALALASLAALPARAQTPPPVATPAPYDVLSITVEGTSSDEMRTFAQQIAGIRAGDKVQLPWDQKFGEAVRRLYSRGQFSNVEIRAEEVAGQGVFLTIEVEEDPKLAGYDIEGLKSGDRNELRPQIPLLNGRNVRPADIETGRLAIQEFLREKGYRLAQVDVQRTVEPDGRVRLVYAVERGDRVSVADIQFVGNESFSESTLRRRLKNTLERRWWRFWKRETFIDTKFEEDLDNLVRFYNDEGFYGARVVSDSVYFRESEDGKNDLVVQVEVDEGNRYHIRDIVFEGNTIYTDEQLLFALDVQSGDVYDRTKLERNLRFSEDNTDVSSLYNDRGYLRFNVREQVVEVPGDSLDLYYEITEGEVYEFGDVRIAGNTRTKEHVIRRELRTVPGQPFSRQAIQRSIRDLSQLNYFDPNSFASGPAIDVDDENRTVDLTYNLAEQSSDQLELSGAWGGRSLGLILSARVAFNNFSIQNLVQGKGPLPAGDGQQLAVTAQRGASYQNYSLSFTEPWFRGRPTPLGFSLGFSDYQDRFNNAYRLRIGSIRTFYQQRLKWPDDFFSTRTSVGYRLYDVTDVDGRFTQSLPEGISQEFTIAQSLSRNSLDNPLFPQAGSATGLTLTVAPPIGDFIQYHKWDLNMEWHTPIAPRVSLGMKSRFGYIGSLTGDEVQFQRYLIGGTPLEASQGGIVAFGREQIFLRGYPRESIGPRREGQPVGGRIANVYQAELQAILLQSPQLSLAPYLFVDAANAWDSFDSYDPSQLFRSAGIGSRIFLPIVGMLDLSLGYQIDPFDGTYSPNETGEPKWDFQISFGGGR
ncbi:MAG: outer membrane protein assembly factor BamA [Bacteroidota bacterium]